MDCDQIVQLFSKCRFNFGNEKELQDGIAFALAGAGIPFAREVQIGNGRIDFMVKDIGIEVKVGGSLSALTRQAHRYLLSEKLTGLVVVSSRTFHDRFPQLLNDKPLRVVGLIQSAI